MLTFRCDCVYHDIRRYKYRLHEEHCFFVPELTDLSIPSGQTRNDRYGYVKVASRPHAFIWFAPGYAWDGCSGPTVDDSTNHIAGLVHDGLYQLLRQGVLPQTARSMADDVFYRLCRIYGMGSFRARYYYRAVRLFAGKNARVQDDPGAELKRICAPVDKV